jgi:hypothetical protein
MKEKYLVPCGSETIKKKKILSLGLFFYSKMSYQLPDFSTAMELVSTLHFKGGHSFCEIETAFRQQHIPIFLFGEEPAKSQIVRGMRGATGKPYLLHVGVRDSRDIALLFADPGCKDEKVNLERLKQTEFAIGPRDASPDSPEEFAAHEVNRLCQHGVPYGKSEYAEPYYTAIMTFLNENTRQKDCLRAKNYIIVKLTINISNTKVTARK